jgi:hypothetical protein
MVGSKGRYVTRPERMMPPILRQAIQYFWFFLVAMFAVRTIAWRLRAMRLVPGGTVAGEDINRFTRVVVIGVLLPAAALGLLTLWAGYPALLCSPFFRPRTPFDLAATSVVVACWVAILWWIWYGGGDELLSRLHRHWPASVLPARMPHTEYESW